MIFSTLIAIANVRVLNELIHRIDTNAGFLVCHIHGYDRLYDCQLRTVLRLGYGRERVGQRSTCRYSCNVFDTK